MEFILQKVIQYNYNQFSLTSINFAVKLLVELQYLCPMSIPNDIVKRLQTRLQLNFENIVFRAVVWEGFCIENGK
jgi:hypothetical protein